LIVLASKKLLGEGGSTSGGLTRLVNLRQDGSWCESVPDTRRKKEDSRHLIKERSSKKSDG